MNIIEAIILGIVQGITEFIPVSSSGHLVLAQEALGVSEVGLSFDIALHLGTLLSLVIFFWRDIIELAGGILGRNDRQRLAWLIILASIPTAIAAFFIRDVAETDLREPWIIATMLISVALLMFWAEHLAKSRKQQTKIEKTSAKQAAAVGLSQVVSLIPGTSRSGITMTTGLLFGMDRVAATRFSFLLAIPIVSGVVLADVVSGGVAESAVSSTVLFSGVLAAFASGVFAIRFLISFLSKHSLAVFAWYRIALGLLVLSGIIAF